MLGVFQIVILCILSCFLGHTLTMLIKSAIELHLINKDIEEIQDRLKRNREERERIEERIKKLEKELEDNND